MARKVLFVVKEIEGAEPLGALYVVARGEDAGMDAATDSSPFTEEGDADATTTALVKGDAGSDTPTVDAKEHK